MKEELKSYIPIFQKEVFKKHKSIDPNDERCWLSITLGWAIAKGMTPDDANAFAIHVRYHT